MDQPEGVGKGFKRGGWRPRSGAGYSKLISFPGHWRRMRQIWGSKTCLNRPCPITSPDLSVSPILAWAFAVILSLFEWRILAQGLPGDTAAAWLAAFILLLGAEAWWIWLIARRRKNWARWISVVVLVVAFPGYIYFLVTKFQNTPILASAYLLDAILWYVSFYFLFTGDAQAWFNRQPVPSIAAEFPRQ
jgi:hypothetical protein